MRDTLRSISDAILLPAALGKADMHLHTDMSDGKDPLDLMLRAASMTGLAWTAVTDHLNGPCFAAGMEIDEYLLRLERAARAFPDLHVLKGMELTVTDMQGPLLSADEKDFDRFDIVLADIGFHTRGIAIDPPRQKGQMLENIRRVLCRLCENPLIDVLAHPFCYGRLIDGFGPDNVPASLCGEIAAACRETDTLFEIQSGAWWWFPALDFMEMTTAYAQLLEPFVDVGVQFIGGSDAHHHQGVGNLAFVKRLMAAAGIGGG